MEIRQINFEGIGGLKNYTNVWSQLKYDGSQYLIHLKNGKGYGLTSKRVSVRTGILNERWDHFKEWHNKKLVPVNGETIIVCEVIAEHLKDYLVEEGIPFSRRSNFVAGIMNSNAETLYNKYEANPLRLVAFDIMYWDGKRVDDKPYCVKYSLLEKCFEYAGVFGENIGEGSLIYYPANQVSWKEYFDELTSKGLEGIVLRDPRTNLSAKMKRQKTADVFIIGYTEGNGKYSEQIGAIKVGVLTKKSKELHSLNLNANKINNTKIDMYIEKGIIQKVGQTSGMSDDIRSKITALNYNLLGSVIEVEYMDWTGKALRNPRFKGFRNDKQVGRCTLEQFE